MLHDLITSISKYKIHILIPNSGEIQIEVILADLEKFSIFALFTEDPIAQCQSMADSIE